MLSRKGILQHPLRIIPARGRRIVTHISEFIWRSWRKFSERDSVQRKRLTFVYLRSLLSYVDVKWRDNEGDAKSLSNKITRTRIRQRGWEDKNEVSLPREIRVSLSPAPLPARFPLRPGK